MPDLLLDRYRLTETVGRGGFSTVEVAWDTRLQRSVAVKRIRLHDAGSSTAADGLQEARTAALLNDQHIVGVIDFEVTADEALIIMEYIDGPDLASLLRGSRTLLDLASVAAIAKDVGGALGHAHSNKVLHLDIKPANILFDAKGHAKVTDFGMAALSAGRGFTEPQGGTAGYMPPEQINGQAVDQRSDLWAFAILIYQLLVGNNPYLAVDAEASLERIESLTLPLPSQVRDDLDPGIDRLFILALSADPQWRQSSVEAFLSELLPYLGSTRSGHMSLRRRVEAFDWDASSQQVADATGWLAGRRHSLGDVAADDSDESDLFDQPGADRLSGAGLPLDNAYIAGSEDNADSADPAARRRPPAAAPVVKETKPLLWLRLNEKAQSILARLLAALATVATVFIGLSGFGLMGLGGGGIATGQPWRPVGGSIELTMPYTPSVLSPAEFRSQLLITLTILLVVGAVALLAPTIGGAIGAISLAAGLLARGLVIIGILTLAAAIAWWLLLGRRGWAESTLLSLAAPLAGLFMPFALPLLAASFMRPVRAVCSALAAWLLLLFVGGLSTPLLADLFASRLLTAGFVLDRAVEQFPPHFWALLTSPLSWLSLLAWLAACLCMLLFSKPGRLLSLKMPGSTESRRRAARKRASDAEASGRPASRLRLSMGAVLATVLQAAVLLVVPLATGNTASATSAGGLSWRLGMSLLFVLVLIQTGMVSGRIAYDDDSNAIDKE